MVSHVALDLPRLVMRRALGVALAFLLLALVLGLVAARRDTQQEIDAALALARFGERLNGLPPDDARAVASLRKLGNVRHLRLHIADAGGRTLFETVEPPPAGPLRWLMRLDGQMDADRPGQAVSWQVPRAAGRSWTVTLTASPESEQREALTNLLGLFGLLAGCSLLMLLVMAWNVRHAMRPLRAMLGAIARIERQDAGGIAALPPMPIRELETMASALRHLAASLDEAEEARRLLARKILTLQEDERQRLARDLHDEFGQRLTALRVDTAWLQKRLAAEPEPAAVLAGMSAQIAHIQQDVRNLLARLQPLGIPDARPAEGVLIPTETVARLASLINLLADGWTRPGGDGLRCGAQVTIAGGGTDSLRLPRELVLAVYRISQEAFTNAARHGAARQARVVVDIDPRAGTLAWSAVDDGVGLARPETALQRGNGLAGIKERVWAMGGEFEFSATTPPPFGGLRLRASFAWIATADEIPKMASADSPAPPLPASPR